MATHGAAQPPFAQELQALKAELQRTLARLSGVTTANGEARWRAATAPASPWSRTSATTTTTTVTTPTTVRSDAASARSEASPAHSDATARILYELVATARRRRQVEMHMARELERESRSREEDHGALEWARGRTAARDAAVDEREAAIRGEIEALRRRRKQILHEIDDESKADEPEHENETSVSAHNGDPKASSPVSASESLARTDRNVSNLSASIKRQSETEYSIEGTVKLGNMSAMEAQREPTRQPTPATPYQHPFTGVAPPPPNYLQYRQPHHDTIQDVFALQLKFAETMLQLEKSIQARDQILVPASSSSMDPTRRRSLSSRRTSTMLRRRARPPPTIHEDRERDPADSSTSGDDNNQAAGPSRTLSSDDEASLSEDTMRLWRRYRLDEPRSRRRSTSSSPNMAASVATTTTSTSPNSQPSPQAVENSVVEASPPAPLQMEEHPTTPSTNDSGNKQVRFNEASATDDYPTPLVARNISFDQDSIDSSEDDDHAMSGTARRSRMMAATLRPAPHVPQAPRKRATVVSSDDEALSFMEGSSVCSADLNDESFLAAFYALRKELRGDYLVPCTPPAKPQPGTAVEGLVPSPVGSTQDPVAVDKAALAQQKRGLTLDIQSLTATLVLAQDAAQREQASAALDRLRRQLRTIEAQEAVAVQT